MGFSFIHTADWQIGKPFRNFSERLAGRLEDARLGAIDRLAELAQRRGIRHVLVAGDVWDSERMPSRIERQPLVRMGRHAGITWVLLPGNHDAARAESVWTRLSALGAPDNVRPMLEARPQEISAGVYVLPAPLTTRQPSRDPTAWMDGAETPAGSLRIGLAHGSIQGFGQDEAGSGTGGIIDAARARQARLDYLALGDWHGTTCINPRTWYSGTPEPDRYKDNEAGEALVVTLGGPGAEPVVERVPTGHFVWIAEALEITASDDLARFEQRLAKRAPALDRVLLRLELTGALPLAEVYRIEAWRERFAAEVADLDCDASAVGVAQGADSLDMFGADGALRSAAETLAAMSATPGESRAREAALALRRLVAILADVRGGGR